jgi:hypothetical protein
MLGAPSASGYRSPWRSSRWRVSTPFSSSPAGTRLELAWIADWLGADPVCADNSTAARNASAGHTPAESDVPSEVECEQLLAFTNHDRSRIITETLERLQKPPFTNQVDHSDQVLRLTLKSQGPVESPG